MKFSLIWKHPFTGKADRSIVSFYYLECHFAGTPHYDDFKAWAKDAKTGDTIELGNSTVKLVKKINEKG